MLLESRDEKVPQHAYCFRYREAEALETYGPPPAG